MIDARIRKHFRGGRESAEFLLDVAFQVREGIAIVFGPSGSGKTLMLDSIAGFVKPDAGRISIGDAVVFDSQARVNQTPQRRRCGYVFQNYALFPHMTLRGNLQFAATRRKGEGASRRVGEMLERFRLTPVAGRRPHEVSGGQKQRCSIARALLTEPRVLLLDEPARGLDPALRQDLYALLRRVREEFSLPVLLVTHDLEECFELGDAMLVVHKGRLAQQGTPAEVIEKPATEEIARLTGVFNLIPAAVLECDGVGCVFECRVAAGALRLHSMGRAKSLRAGDQVTVCLRPDELTAEPGDAVGAPGSLAAVLRRVSRRPGTTLLEFEGGIQVTLPREAAETAQPGEKWTIRFPAEVTRVV